LRSTMRSKPAPTNQPITEHGPRLPQRRWR
jgi:hypothetical protein